MRNRFISPITILLFALAICFSGVKAENVTQVIVEMTGESHVGLIDSISATTVYYQDQDTQLPSTLPLKDVYLIYNEFQRVFYYSPSLIDRMELIEERGGVLTTRDGQEHPYSSLRFNRHMVEPFVYITTATDSFYRVNLLQVYRITSDLSIMETSVKKGLLTTVVPTTGLLLFQISRNWIGGFSDVQIISWENANRLSVIAADEIKKILPRADVAGLSATGTLYEPFVFATPAATMGWMGYDYYMNKGTHYFVPTSRQDKFPRSMFRFSLKHWWKNNRPF